MTGETLSEPFDMTKLDGDGLGTDEYYAARWSKVQSGELTWIRTTFDIEPDTPDQYDFYRNGQLIGSITHLGWPYCENHTYTFGDDTTVNLGSLREAVDHVEQD